MLGAGKVDAMAVAKLVKEQIAAKAEAPRNGACDG